jgi:hypothetical protein
MESKRPDPTPELTTVGLLPVQFFVSRAIPMPPGTPARPRANRPPLEKPDEKSTDQSENEEEGPHSA